MKFSSVVVIAFFFTAVFAAVPTQRQIHDLVDQAAHASQKGRRFEAQALFRESYDEWREAPASAALLRFLAEYCDNATYQARKANPVDQAEAWRLVIDIYDMFETKFMRPENPRAHSTRILLASQAMYAQRLFHLRNAALLALGRRDVFFNAMERSLGSVSVLQTREQMELWLRLLYNDSLGQPVERNDRNDREVRGKIRRSQRLRDRWKVLVKANQEFMRLPHWLDDAERIARELRALGLGA